VGRTSQAAGQTCDGTIKVKLLSSHSHTAMSPVAGSRPWTDPEKGSPVGARRFMGHTVESGTPISSQAIQL